MTEAALQSRHVAFSRPKIEGKFLWLDREKFYVKGVTYGAFPPNGEGHQFPGHSEVEIDFALMERAGINSILTYTVPPISLLDQAQEHGLRVIVNIPWMAYVCFLQERTFQRKVRREVREAVASCRRHPAVMMYCVAKEIPPSIVRWHGPRKVEAFLKDLYHVAKNEDPGSLVTYTNFPTTEYLELPFVDVCSFNVYLHRRPEMCEYLARLQHLAGELPLVLTEFGMCSLRHGREEQAAFLDWQIEEAFDHGLAGAVVFGWTDPFFQDNLLIDEWGFGLVDANRRPKPSYEAVRRRLTSYVPFPPGRRWPKVSVVVAACNAGHTLDECLESLRKVRYPDYEVIVVDDGSTDDTAAIMSRYPEFVGISTSNQGVSGARNEGRRAAGGEIIAYIDSDAYADPDWLSHLATTYLKFDVVGVGGPNLVPPQDNWVAKCVYRAPGGPTQVMLDDRFAEHIPGCNMSFRKSALEDVGGFDPVFRAAADDVDICWRLLDRGYKIGFSPSATVWHHRRPSLKAYWRQQVGYGISESILERKFPNKFNPWGHTFWNGRIYAPYPFFRLFSRPVIYQGLWGSAPFQPMYSPGGSGLLTFLPRAMEWHVALAFLFLLGFVSPWAFLPMGIGLVYTAFYCAVCASSAKLDVLLSSEPRATWTRRLRWRATIAWLNFLEPFARDWGRLKGGLTPWRSAFPGALPKCQATSWWQRLQPFRRTAHWSFPGNMALEKFAILSALTGRSNRHGYAVGWNPSHADWDIRIRRGALVEAYARTVVEHHGGSRRLARFMAVIRPTKSVNWLLGSIGGIAALLGARGFLLPAGALAISLAVLWTAVATRATRLETGLIAASADVVQELQSKAAESAPRVTADEAAAELAPEEESAGA